MQRAGPSHRRGAGAYHIHCSVNGRYRDWFAAPGSDTAWWFGAGLVRPVERALAAALACAIAEPCDGMIVESDEERVFGSVEAFLEAWPTFSAP